jgi:hypothetical protein
VRRKVVSCSRGREPRATEVACAEVVETRCPQGV